MFISSVMGKDLVRAGASKEPSLDFSDVSSAQLRDGKRFFVRHERRRRRRFLIGVKEKILERRELKCTKRASSKSYSAGLGSSGS